MKTFYRMIVATLATLSSMAGFAQDDSYQIRTIFNNHGKHASGGYAALTNKFTSINGDFANMVEVYGGWYINHRLLIGLGGAGTTNYIPVETAYSAHPMYRMSYQYSQAGLMTEYVIGSNRAIHISFQVFAGAGFTMQYERPDWVNDPDWDDHWDDDSRYEIDGDFLLVAEPGMKIEVNVFRWLRLCPGMSYRFTEGSQGRGLGKNALDGTSVNFTVKIGKF